MKIGDENDYIELVELDRGEAGSEQEGQRRLSVHVKLRDFQGWYDKIWVLDGALDNFVTGLAEFSNDCTGHIKLHSANPNEFILNFLFLCFGFSVRLCKLDWINSWGIPKFKNERIRKGA